MIELGQVFVTNTKTCKIIPVKKPGQMMSPKEIQIELKKENLLKYVSRSGFKLEGALDHLDQAHKWDYKKWQALDVGQSTGGFTDCLLQRGILHVTGIDVATQELAQSLVGHPKVTTWTQLNVRELDKHPAFQNVFFELIVVDVSFISLDKVLPVLMGSLKANGRLLALVKPQFEVGSANIGKNGVVKNLKIIIELEEKMLQLAKQIGLIDTLYFKSTIKGRDGNQEFFLYGKKK